MKTETILSFFIRLTNPHANKMLRKGSSAQDATAYGEPQLFCPHVFLTAEAGGWKRAPRGTNRHEELESICIGRGFWSGIDDRTGGFRADRDGSTGDHAEPPGAQAVAWAARQATW